MIRGETETERSPLEALNNVQACSFCARDPILFSTPKCTNSTHSGEECLWSADWVPGEGSLRVRRKPQSAPSVALPSSNEPYNAVTYIWERNARGNAWDWCAHLWRGLLGGKKEDQISFAWNIWWLHLYKILAQKHKTPCHTPHGDKLSGNEILLLTGKSAAVLPFFFFVSSCFARR